MSCSASQSEQIRPGGLLQRITSQRNRQLHLTQLEASAQTKADFRDYSLARRRMAQLILAAAETDLEKAKQRKEELARLDSEKERLEKALAAALPDFAANLQNQRSQPQELVAQLPPNMAFIDLVRYTLIEQDPDIPGKKGERRTPNYAAFVVHRNQPIARVELGAAEPIDQAASAWRAAIAEGRSERKPAETLGRVWQQLAQAVPNDVKTLYLCPDSSLAVIPWAAIPVGNDRVLLEDYSVAVVPHGHFLLLQLMESPEGVEASERLLLVGDVSYDDRPAKLAAKPAQSAQLTRDAAIGDKRIWVPLPSGKREVSNVAGLAGSRTVTALETDHATTRRVLRELPRCQYAHVATHGFFANKKFRSNLQMSQENFERARGFGRISSRSTFAGRNPLVLSGLVFAGANLPRQKDEYGVPTDDGGILTAESIASLPLYDLKLAVLSACETGLGDVAGGEGVYGLQSAFHTAGTHNVVASLWKVNDDATAALMRLFYYKLWKEKKPPLEALREAQLYLYRNPTKIKDLARAPNFDKTIKLDNSTPSTKRSPTRDWAAFVLSGLGR